MSWSSDVVFKGISHRKLKFKKCLITMDEDRSSRDIIWFCYYMQKQKIPWFSQQVQTFNKKLAITFEVRVFGAIYNFSTKNRCFYNHQLMHKLQVVVFSQASRTLSCQLDFFCGYNLQLMQKLFLTRWYISVRMFL